MKKLYIVILALLVSLPLWTSCAPAPEKEMTPSASETENSYREQIAILEAQLAKQKEEKFISDIAYKAKIAELEGKLALLAPDTESGAGQDSVGDKLIFTYRLENGKAILTGYEGSSTLVTVPSTLDGYPVVAIGERAFEGKNIAAITLPQGLEAVGWFAFYGCERLIDVSIPTSVTSIGYAVFDGCPHVCVVCEADSYAAHYAKSYGLPCVIT